jgi:hypothetical protein
MLLNHKKGSQFFSHNPLHSDKLFMRDIPAESVACKVNTDDRAGTERTSVFCEESAKIRLLCLYVDGYTEQKVNQDKNAVAFIAGMYAAARSLAIYCTISTFLNYP